MQNLVVLSFVQIHGHGGEQLYVQHCSGAPHGRRTCDATGNQLQELAGDDPRTDRSGITSPSTHHDLQVHSKATGTKILSLLKRCVTGTRVLTNATRERIECSLTTVEDDTDGTDEDYNVDTARAETVSGSLQLTITDSEQALMSGLRRQPVPIAVDSHHSSPFLQDRRATMREDAHRARLAFPCETHSQKTSCSSRR